MPFIERTGVRIHYEINGDSSLPLLVLSHALGVNMAMWDPQLDALGSRFRLLRYDTRGHGRSSVPSGPYTIADLGGDVLHLLDTLNIAQASFCGLSMGGLIGQWLGIHAPERLHRLILANTAAKIGTEEGWNSRIAGVLREGLHPVIAGTLERWFTADFWASHLEAVEAIESVLRSTDPEGYAGCCAAIRDADFRAHLNAVQVPALVIAGTYDPSTTPGDGRFLADTIPDARYVELAAAHLSNLEAAGEFSAAILDFLGR